MRMGFGALALAPQIRMHEPRDSPTRCPVRGKSIDNGIVRNVFAPGVITRNLEVPMKAMLILNDQSVVVGVDIVPIYIDIGDRPTLFGRAALKVGSYWPPP